MVSSELAAPQWIALTRPVSSDGQRIFLMQRNDDPAPHEINVVLGWRALLR